MPLIQVNAPEGVLTSQSQDVLMARLSNAVLKAEGAPIEDPAAQSLVWAHYIEHPKGTTYVGGEAIDKPPLRIAVTTPEGALNDETRKTLVEDIGAIVDDVYGPFEGRLNHWAMLYEVMEGGWAGGGQIFPLAGIQAAMNIKAA
ncbi:MAG: hypothetical protein CMI63_14500 [Parvularcula sp.]|jgi:phenylpyruvate tautomerase PptA (4-oxalocrotonate tautomerase family)|nr:hypothetical protein [Parvularcula sp.]